MCIVTLKLTSLFFLYIQEFLFLFFIYIYFIWRLITLQHCIGFAIHQHELQFSQDICPVVGLLGHMVVLFLVFSPVTAFPYSSDS